MFDISKLPKYKFLLAVFSVIIFLVSVSFIQAQTDNQTSGGIVYPQISVEPLSIGPNLKSGSTSPLSFTLNNSENRASFDIGYRIYLLDSKKAVYFQKDFPKRDLFAPFEKITETPSVSLPTNFPAGDYDLQVVALAPDNSELGSTQRKVKVEGATANQTTDSSVTISSGTQQSPDSTGVVINAGETVTAHVTVVSPTEARAKVKYAIFGYENFSRVQIKDGNTVALKTGDNKFDIAIKSGDSSYSAAVFWLENSSGVQISPLQKISWGVWGTQSNLKYLTIDKLQAKVGESVAVEVVVDPILSKSNNDFKAKVKVWVDNSSGTGEIDFSKTSSALVKVKLAKNINKPVIRVELDNNGSPILNYKTTNKSTVKSIVANNALYIILVLLAVVLFLVAGYLLKRKKLSLKIIILLIFSFFFLVGLKQNLLASVTTTSSYTAVPAVNTCRPASSYFYVRNLFVYQNGSISAAVQGTLFRPGDTIDYSVTLSSGNAFCSYFGSASYDYIFAGTSVTDPTTVADSFDVNSNKNTTVGVVVRSDIRSSGTAGRVRMERTMAITMGPRAIDAATMSETTPSCSSGATYNNTFNWTGRNLADNYDIEWATDSGFTTDFGKVTTGLSLGGAKTFTTTTKPFDRTKTYYWRIKAYNSIPGSAIYTNGSSTFGPVSLCPPDLISDSLNVTGVLNPGQTLTLSGHISNGGGSSVTVVTDSLFQLDEAPIPGVYSDLATVSTPQPITVGSYQYVQTTWVATLGTHRFKLCADSGNVVSPEVSEANNCDEKTFTVTLAPNNYVITENGNVGSVGTIDNLDTTGHNSAANNSNVEYIRQTSASINGAFLSWKNWLVNYRPEPKLSSKNGTN